VVEDTPEGDTITVETMAHSVTDTVLLNAPLYPELVSVMAKDKAFRIAGSILRKVDGVDTNITL
jgi:hypothetical protein